MAENEPIVEVAETIGDQFGELTTGYTNPMRDLENQDHGE